jgi:hypothetical protein
VFVPNPEHERLFAAMRRLRVGWPARGWSWERDPPCVASTFSRDFESAAQTALGDVFSQEWSAANVFEAPPRMRELVERYGGLGEGHRLLSSGALGGRLVLFGWWMPWTDRETISVRLGFAGFHPMVEPYVRGRDIFGVLL